MSYSKTREKPYRPELRILLFKGEPIGHLDFRKAPPIASMLEQMLNRAIFDPKINSIGNAIDLIEDGFAYAEEILGAGYSETNLPKLKEIFETLKNQYKI